jgi:selenocysteine lyase/cysteine desulfurase
MPGSFPIRLAGAEQVQAAPMNDAKDLATLLERRYHLSVDDLRSHAPEFTDQKLDEQRLHQLILGNEPLLILSIRNSIAALGYDETEFDTYELSVLARFARDRLSSVFCDMLTALETDDSLHSLVELRSKTINEFIDAEREFALNDFSYRHSDLVSQFSDTPFARTDEEMHSDFYVRSFDGNRYLTTYFDTAQFGLNSRSMDKRAERLASGSKRDWPQFVQRMKRRMVSRFEPDTPQSEKRFVPERCFIAAQNGSEAFRKFCEVNIHPGQVVAAAEGEYSDFVKTLKEHWARVVILPSSSSEQFTESLNDLFETEEVAYVLASEVGRKGEVTPLKAIHESRSTYSPNTKLIVDACQSAGRYVQKFDECQADIAVFSSHKGSDFSTSVGVVALAKDFEGQDLEDYRGTEDEVAIASTAMALDPHQGPSTEERQTILGNLARNTMSLVHEVNQGNGNRIQILSPSDSKLAHCLELEIEGVSRQTVHEIAKSYGVHIASSYTDPSSENSFRLAFHPYMGKTSLVLLGAVLEKCLDGKVVEEIEKEIA